MEFWCRIMLDGSARLGLRQDEQVLIHEGALLANAVSTGQRVAVDEVERPATRVIPFPAHLARGLCAGSNRMKYDYTKEST